MDELDEITLRVPQLSGTLETIRHLRSNEAFEILGLYARPDGCNDAHLGQMRTRVEDWTTLVKNGALPTRSVWTSYTHQLWAGLKYGLGASSAPMEALRKGLGSSDYYFISSLGVVRSIKKEWRYLPSGDYLYSLMQHYNTKTALGITLTASLEELQLELGVQGCPLTYDYEIWGHLAEYSWIKALWEKVYRLDIDLRLDYKDLEPPRAMDRCLMELCVEARLRGKQLLQVNRARICQEVVFISYIASKTGDISSITSSKTGNSPPNLT
ncbi:hypothetical protein ACHAXR_007365 [Thalassiosira sp. AJA248-18]